MKQSLPMLSPVTGYFGSHKQCILSCNLTQTWNLSPWCRQIISSKHFCPWWDNKIVRYSDPSQSTHTYVERTTINWITWWPNSCWIKEILAADDCIAILDHYLSNKGSCLFQPWSIHELREANFMKVDYNFCMIIIFEASALESFMVRCFESRKGWEVLTCHYYWKVKFLSCEL